MNNILDVVEKYNNYEYNTKYFESLTDILNNFNLNTNINADFFNVMCTNVRSVNANFDELLLYLENDISYKKIDILILTKTWHNVQDCEYTIPDYNTYFSTTKRNQNDGVIIFVKCSLSVNLVEFGYLESNIIKLSLCINNTPLLLYCVYRSPAVTLMTSLPIYIIFLIMKTPIKVIRS